MTDVSAPSTKLRRTIYDAKHGASLPAPGRDTPVRNEGDPAASDLAVNEAYDFSGKTYEFYKSEYRSKFSQ